MTKSDRQQAASFSAAAEKYGLNEHEFPLKGAKYAWKYAAKASNFATIRAVIKADSAEVAINWSRPESGWGCIHHAAEQGREDVYQWLLDHGAVDTALPTVAYRWWSECTALQLLECQLSGRHNNP